VHWRVPHLDSSSLLLESIHKSFTWEFGGTSYHPLSPSGPSLSPVGWAGKMKMGPEELA
jgi:hypothetical protein